VEALVAVVEYHPVVAEVEPQGGYQVALWRRGERAKEAHVTKRLLALRLVNGCTVTPLTRTVREERDSEMEESTGSAAEEEKEREREESSSSRWGGGGPGL
jgi:hypothetical protein